MPSVNALSIMALAVGGAALAGTAAWKHSAKDQSMDTADRAGYTASLAIGGATGALALNHIGLGRLSKGLGHVHGAAKTAAKYGSWRPGKAAMGALGIKRIPGAKKAFGGLALLAGSIGALAYGAHKAEASAGTVNQPDEDRMPQRSSTRERLGLLGATGDLVFGLNNARHG